MQNHQEKILEFKRDNSIIINEVAIKVLVNPHKANITGGIIYLIILIIYLLFFKFFIKVYIMISNKKQFICHLVLDKFYNDNDIILKSLTNSFSRYNNALLI